MSYLVLARKWRPQTFAQIIGQPHVSQTLQNAIEARRVAHAYLFTGARGVGKTSVARIFAKALNCEQGSSAHPCNICSNCREITLGNAVDVLEIDGASNRGIDSIRELRETIRYRPAKSRHKIFIIDEVHMLTTEAFNALLKTLEEPPEHIVFIFATTEPHKIPATILSRCQRFDFRRIATGQIVAHLQHIAREEHLQLEETLLYAIAREAEGSMRDAQSLLEQLLAFSVDGQVDSEVLDLLGVIDRHSVQGVGRAVLAGDPQTCLEVVADVYRRGMDIKRFCHQLCEYFRNLTYLSLGGDEAASYLDLPAEERKTLEQDLQHTSTDGLQLYFQMLLKGEEDLRRSTLPRMTLEMLLLRLTQLPRLESLQNLMGQLMVLEQHWQRKSSSGHVGPAVEVDAGQTRYRSGDPGTPGSGSAIRPSESSESNPAGEVISSKPKPDPMMDVGFACADAAEAAKHWTRFMGWLANRDQLLAAKLAHGKVRSSPDQDSCLELDVVPLYEDSLKEAKALDRLTSAARTYFGLTLSWKIGSLQQQGAGPASGAKSQSSRAKSHQKVLEHPVVQQALEVLSGELIEIRRLKPGDRKQSGRSPASASDAGEPGESP
ncbi:MAG TPA: DNA polymerase III subunit gamma/tau [Syntrophobacteraceae bacterium]|nr:DNA polymerase III subunit gamma/tau [Syntrophobacteraceae bacterium]